MFWQQWSHDKGTSASHSGLDNNLSLFTFFAPWFIEPSNIFSRDKCHAGLTVQEDRKAESCWGPIWCLALLDMAACTPQYLSSALVTSQATSHTPWYGSMHCSATIFDMVVCTALDSTEQTALLCDMISVQCTGVQCTVLQARHHTVPHTKLCLLETIADWEAGDLSMSHCCQPTNEKK